MEKGCTVQGGTQILAGGVDARDLFVEVNDSGEPTAHITSLDSKVKRLRIKVKSYKEAVFEVDVTDGATF